MCRRDLWSSFADQTGSGCKSLNGGGEGGGGSISNQEPQFSLDQIDWQLLNSLADKLTTSQQTSSNDKKRQKAEATIEADISEAKGMTSALGICPPMTLDSILEGILEDENDGSNSSSDVGGLFESTTSDSASSSPRFAAEVSRDETPAGSTLSLDPISVSGVPCISIKTELPDSCSMEIMVGKHNLSEFSLALKVRSLLHRNSICQISLRNGKFRKLHDCMSLAVWRTNVDMFEKERNNISMLLPESSNMCLLRFVLPVSFNFGGLAFRSYRNLFGRLYY